MTQICLALAALILRAVEHGKPIEQLFYSLQTLQNQDDGNIAVLEMLTVLPEEVVDTQNTDTSISPAHRSQYGQEVYVHSFYTSVSVSFGFPPFSICFAFMICSPFSFVPDLTKLNAASLTYSYGARVPTGSISKNV